MSYQSPTKHSSYAKKPAMKLATTLTTMLLTALPMVAVLGASSVLSGCGFHLRGYDAPLRFEVAKTAVVIEDNRTSFPLKLPLIERLEALGIDVVDSMSLIENAANNASKVTDNNQIATITVNNVRFKRYELVGVLTEIRLVLSADVTYQTVQNGQPVTLTNPVQVERSYQYNEGAVSTDDQQGSQIRDWLYDNLARRITDQYVAISLPRRAPDSANKSTSIVKNPMNKTDETIIIAPKP